MTKAATPVAARTMAPRPIPVLDDSVVDVTVSVAGGVRGSALLLRPA